MPLGTHSARTRAKKKGHSSDGSGLLRCNPYLPGDNFSGCAAPSAQWSAQQRPAVWTCSGLGRFFPMEATERLAAPTCSLPAERDEAFGPETVLCLVKGARGLSRNGLIQTSTSITSSVVPLSVSSARSPSVCSLWSAALVASVATGLAGIAFMTFLYFVTFAHGGDCLYRCLFIRRLRIIVLRAHIVFFCAAYCNGGSRGCRCWASAVWLRHLTGAQLLHFPLSWCQ